MLSNWAIWADVMAPVVVVVVCLWMREGYLHQWCWRLLGYLMNINWRVKCWMCVLCCAFRGSQPGIYQTAQEVNQLILCPFFFLDGGWQLVIVCAVFRSLILLTSLEKSNCHSVTVWGDVWPFPQIPWCSLWTLWSLFEPILHFFLRHLLGPV